MSRKRLLFISIAIVLLVGAGTVLILSVEGILQGSWTNLLTAVFVILGVLFTFLQWALPPLPISSAEPKTPRGSSKSDEDIPRADITLFEENSDA